MSEAMFYLAVLLAVFGAPLWVAVRRMTARALESKGS